MEKFSLFSLDENGENVLREVRHNFFGVIAYEAYYNPEGKMISARFYKANDTISNKSVGIYLKDGKLHYALTSPADDREFESYDEWAEINKPKTFEYHSEEALLHTAFAESKKMVGLKNPELFLRKALEYFDDRMRLNFFDKYMKEADTSSIPRDENGELDIVYLARLISIGRNIQKVANKGEDGEDLEFRLKKLEDYLKERL
ncbi:MAG: hypothetical protein N4A44_00855 [Alphaproteobacteria bacterium]|jgi:hypothetical protein|nr:hypothetical protein [Alphaproteobacteria bacterium]